MVGSRSRLSDSVRLQCGPRIYIFKSSRYCLSFLHISGIFQNSKSLRDGEGEKDAKVSQASTSHAHLTILREKSLLLGFG